MSDEEWEEELEEEKSEWIDEKIGEIQNIDLYFE